MFARDVALEPVANGAAAVITSGPPLPDESEDEPKAPPAESSTHCSKLHWTPRKEGQLPTPRRCCSRLGSSISNPSYERRTLIARRHT